MKFGTAVPIIVNDLCAKTRVNRTRNEGGIPENFFEVLRKARRTGFELLYSESSGHQTSRTLFSSVCLVCSPEAFSAKSL